MDAGLVVLILLIIAAVVVALVYNRLVALRQTTRQAWGDIDVQLKQRHDLVPNLVETVKGYATHEKETLEKVVQARQQAVDASGLKDQAQAENLLSGALRQLFALAESYPDLKANTNFLALQNELADLENKIAAARRFFNNAVAEYNTAIEQFPAVLLAGPFGFKREDFFEVAASERARVEAAPSVKF
ncbi:LemA family protein [Marinicauda algicola]|uniref:LemA family protein n=1 Tax=Marinicauda algicola TaxID=2029849 RepID=A0A4V3RXU4_9PROT|nr:LemA family protein [Marinicauda algicola]TGY87839.1 LemA family protein [Marinicauda algicola]